MGRHALFRRRAVAWCVAVVAAIWGHAVSPASAQGNPTYMAFGAAKGLLYRPDAGPALRTGVLVMHRTANYLQHPACTELSRRGFVVLCMNSRFENNEVGVSFEVLPLDVAAGVRALRAQPGLSRVILFGHSGGGPLMALYQAVAENGPGFCRGPDKLVSCTDALAGLPPADGIVFADAHPGNAVLVLRALNPSVASEANPPVAPPDPALDPFDPRNGYARSGASRYEEAFRRTYYAAQSARMNRLIETALGRVAAMREGRDPYPDNDVVVIPRGGPQGSGPGASAYLWITDPTVPEVMRTARPARLLRNDGTIEDGRVVASVAVADPTNAERNLAFNTGTKMLSLRSFLSANAVRSRDSVEDIDHCSTNNSTVCAVQSIRVPVLFAAMGAFSFIRDNERMFEVSRSADKEFIVIEGATHGFTPCVPCEPFPGAYSNSVRNLFDHVAAWERARQTQ